MIHSASQLPKPVYDERNGFIGFWASKQYEQYHPSQEDLAVRMPGGDGSSCAGSHSSAYALAAEDDGVPDEGMLVCTGHNVSTGTSCRSDMPVSHMHGVQIWFASCCYAILVVTSEINRKAAPRQFVELLRADDVHFDEGARLMRDEIYSDLARLLGIYVKHTESQVMAGCP